MPPGFLGLVGRNVLVTGAASGIAKAIALRLGDERAVVGALDRDEGGAKQTVAEITGAGGRAFSYAADIRDGEAVERAVAAFERDAASFAQRAAGERSPSGAIGGLVNGAGWDHAANFLDTTPDDWRTVIDINLYGPLHVTRAVLRRMVAARAGRIVSLSSDAGRVGSSGEAVYAACKGGITAFAKSIAREHASSGISINVVAPGPTDTPLFARFDPSGKLAAALERSIPMKRLAQPSDYPGLVAFLLSDEAAFITGQTISVSGGLTMHG